MNPGRRKRARTSVTRIRREVARIAAIETDRSQTNRTVTVVFVQNPVRSGPGYATNPVGATDAGGNLRGRRQRGAAAEIGVPEAAGPGDLHGGESRTIRSDTQSLIEIQIVGDAAFFAGGKTDRPNLRIRGDAVCGGTEDESAEPSGSQAIWRGKLPRFRSDLRWRAGVCRDGFDYVLRKIALRRLRDGDDFSIRGPGRALKRKDRRIVDGHAKAFRRSHRHWRSAALEVFGCGAWRPKTNLLAVRRKTERGIDIDQNLRRRCRRETEL